MSLSPYPPRGPRTYLLPARRTINDEIKKTQDWLEEFGATAEIADLDEQREALQAIVSPITSKIVRPPTPRLSDLF